jgi:tetratricopeptide (TPR) repeat protein
VVLLPEGSARQEYPWLQRISRGWKAYQKSFSSGREHAREALDLFAGAAGALREKADYENLPMALDGMGAALHLLGTAEELRQADKCYDEEIRLLERAKNVQELAQAVSSEQAVLRDLALLTPESAFACLEKGLRLGEKGMTLAARTRDEKSLAWVSQTTADLCCVLAQTDRSMAETHLSTAIDLYQKAGVLWERVAARGRPREGAQAAVKEESDAGSQAGALPREAAEGKALSLLGMVEAYVMMGKNLDSARVMLDEARSFYTRAGTGSYQMAHVESLSGSLALAEGDREEALKHFKDATDTFRRLGFSSDGSDALGD